MHLKIDLRLLINLLIFNGISVTILAQNSSKWIEMFCAYIYPFNMVGVHMQLQEPIFLCTVQCQLFQATRTPFLDLEQKYLFSFAALCISIYSLYLTPLSMLHFHCQLLVKPGDFTIFKRKRIIVILFFLDMDCFGAGFL